MMEEKTLNIVLIDQQQLFREGVKSVLETEEMFHIIVTGDDYSIVETVLLNHEVDIIIIDINVFKKHKHQIKNQLLHDQSNIKVVVLSGEGEESYITEAVKLGVHGYLLREMNVFNFIEAIKLVFNGLSYIHPTVTHDLIEDYRSLTQLGNGENAFFQKPLHLYTKRECEVLQLLTNGQSNRKIAETLNISEKTVKNHVSSLFKKMNVNDRTQAVVTAIRNNWVEL